MSSFKGTILDATALIDFRWLDEWDWLRTHYGPLFIAWEVLDADQLEPEERAIARAQLAPLHLDTQPMYADYASIGDRGPGLSSADRATLILAQHYRLTCATDDGRMVRECESGGIAFVRTLQLLSKMVEAGHRSTAEVLEMAEMLIGDRGKYVSERVLRRWKRSLTAD